MNIFEEIDIFEEMAIDIIPLGDVISDIEVIAYEQPWHGTVAEQAGFVIWLLFLHLQFSNRVLIFEENVKLELLPCLYCCGVPYGLCDYVFRWIVIILTPLVFALIAVYVFIWGLISMGFYSARGAFPNFPIPQWPFWALATFCAFEKSGRFEKYYSEGWEEGKSRPVIIWNFLCDTAPGSRARWRIQAHEGAVADCNEALLMFSIGLETVLENVGGLLMISKKIKTPTSVVSLIFTILSVFFEIGQLISYTTLCD